MGLIDSPRITAADRAVWQRLEHYDDALSRDPRLDQIADKARKTIEDFAATGPCRLGISWGKDSVVCGHLLATSKVANQVPLIWVKLIIGDNPDCDIVRDAFFAKHPHMRANYIEHIDEETPMQLFDYTPIDPANPGKCLWNLDGRYISGVRSRESGTRHMTMRRNGLASRNTCRPIGWWTGEQVFAYLHKEDLPIHPAYAMTMGGRLNRVQLRVSHIGGERGTRFGRDVWERTYYPDVYQRVMFKDPEETR